MANYTLNYTGEKVDELLNKIDTAFGETTVMSDALTWDGDMTGKVYVEMEMPIDEEGNTTPAYLVNVSDSVPTIEDLQAGGSFTVSGQTMSFEHTEINDIGSAITISQNILIAKEDSADLTDMLGIILPKKGVYVVSIPAMGVYISTFTINNYTGFKTTEIKTIDAKYIPASDDRTYFYADGNNQLYVDEARTTLATYLDIETAYKKGQIIIKQSLFHYIPTTINLVAPFMATLWVLDGGTNAGNSGTAGFMKFTVGSAD